MSVSVKTGSLGERDADAGLALWGGWRSVWTRQPLGSTWPTFLQWRPSLPLLSQLRAGVTVPALKTRSWPWSGWHVATGLTRSLQVVLQTAETLASIKLACEAVSLCLQSLCVEKKNKFDVERRGLTNTEALVFLRPLLPLSILLFLFSLPPLILVCLFLVIEELFFISIVHKCKKGGHWSSFLLFSNILTSSNYKARNLYLSVCPSHILRTIWSTSHWVYCWGSKDVQCGSRCSLDMWYFHYY